MIEGGYILLARQLLESDIMDKPPHYLKLWVWMLGKAFWADGNKLKRGQFLTSIAEMQKEGGHKVGYRQKDLTRDEVRSAYEAFTKTHMITTTKTTRGMIITICNYDFYQNPNNYEPHNEHTTKTQRTPNPPHTIDEEGIRRNKKEKKDNKPFYSEDFLEFWKAYPKKTAKGSAWEEWKKAKPPLEKVLATLAWQKVSHKWAVEGYILDPERYIKRRCWEDEPFEGPRPKQGLVTIEQQKEINSRKACVDFLLGGENERGRQETVYLEHEGFGNCTPEGNDSGCLEGVFSESE